jgi:hypothetical protein
LIPDRKTPVVNFSRVLPLNEAAGFFSVLKDTLMNLPLAAKKDSNLIISIPFKFFG